MVKIYVKKKKHKDKDNFSNFKIAIENLFKKRKKFKQNNRWISLLKFIKKTKKVEKELVVAIDRAE